MTTKKSCRITYAQDKDGSQNKAKLSPKMMKNKSFTLIELIVVIIIVGVLAAVGISQYSLVVEKGRIAEARMRLGTMRQLAYEYYLNNGTLTGLTDNDVGSSACVSTGFYRYWIMGNYDTWMDLGADRCTSGGKTPNTSRRYYYWLRYFPGNGSSEWHCTYTDDWSSCFGLPN